MTRKELLSLVASRLQPITSGVSNETIVEDVLDATFALIAVSLANGEDVKIMNFGKFEARYHEAVTRRNPKTGEAINVPAKRTLGFKPAPKLKDAVNS